MTVISIFIRSMSGGGAQRAMVRLATGFAEAGFTVEVLTLEPEGTYREELSDSVHLVPLNATRILTAVPALARYIRRRRPAALLVTEPACNIAVILAKLCSRNTSSRVLIREGLFPSIAAKQSPHKATRLAYRFAPFLYRYADVIVAIATEMTVDLARFARLPIDRITTIPVNPVVTPALQKATAGHPDHPWFNDNIAIILGVGRLDRQKDFITLIEAFNLVREQKTCRLVIVGEGPSREELEAVRASSAFAADIALPGFVSKPYALMANCDVFVLSSRYEGQPNVLIEALACGAPVVATNCPSGPADILEQGRFGRLVPVGDASTMATAILDTLENPLDVEMSRRRGQQFTIAKSANLYLDALFPNIEHR